MFIQKKTNIKYVASGLTYRKLSIIYRSNPNSNNMTKYETTNCDLFRHLID